MSFISIYTSGFVTAFASFGTIVCFFVIVYQYLLSEKQNTQINNGIFKLYSFLEKLIPSVWLMRRVSQLNQFIDNKYGKPVKINYFDKYFYSENILTISLFVSLLPLLFLCISSKTLLYLWGPSTFLSLYLNPFLKKGEKKITIGVYWLMSLYNFAFYSIPILLGYYIFHNQKFAISFEIMRSSAVVFTVFSFLFVFSVAQVRLLIINMDRFKIKLLALFRYLNIAFLIIVFSLLVIYAQSWLVQKMQDFAPPNIKPQLIGFDFYFYIALSVLLLPIFLGIILSLIILSIKYIVYPLLVITKCMIRFIYIRKMHIFLFALFSAILLSSIGANVFTK
jgi:hypothetical protein